MQRRPLDGQATGVGAPYLVLGCEQLVAADGGARATEAQVEGDGERQAQPEASPHRQVHPPAAGPRRPFGGGAGGVPGRAPPQTDVLDDGRRSGSFP